MKICSKCKEAKELSEFHKSPTCKDGLRPDCKLCVSVYRKNDWNTKKEVVKKTYETRVVSSKKCPKCNLVKTSAEFGKKVYQPDGLNTHCKPCANIVDKNRREIRKSRGIKKPRTENAKAYQKKWYSENREKLSLQRSEYRRTPAAKAKINTRKAFRRSLERHGQLKWLSKSQKDEIKQLYYQAQTMSEFHETKFEVDHIEPLVGKNSCGLTVPWNLRVIHWTENRTKGNKLLNQLP